MLLKPATASGFLVTGKKIKIEYCVSDTVILCFPSTMISHAFTNNISLFSYLFSLNISLPYMGYLKHNCPGKSLQGETLCQLSKKMKA